jgi:hypothetical protein
MKNKRKTNMSMKIARRVGWDIKVEKGRKKND